MEAKIIDGTAFSATLCEKIATGVEKLKGLHHLVPGLAVVLVGSDPASQVYVRNKNRRALEVGMRSFEHRLPADVAEGDLLALIAALNADETVHGVLVQLPLPGHIDSRRVIDAIDPAKDVDGFHPVNVGALAVGQDALVPCTPLGCLMLLRDCLDDDLSGRKAVIIGRSNIVGKPMAQLLLRENCTVTITHSKTRDLPGECRQADILVAAIGRPQFVRGEWIKPGATVIDVGINRIPVDDSRTRLVGDVCFDEVRNVAGAITPVPGGVGPMTIAVLLRNTLAAACRQNALEDPLGALFR